VRLAFRTAVKSPKRIVTELRSTSMPMADTL
jgi:hypothetical protein